MENNNYLSSGVNYLPLTILDKDHATFINQLAPFPTYDGTKIGNDGRYSFGFGKPQQFKFYDSNTEIYDVAGIKRGDDESGVFVNNNGDRGIQVWLYFGDNYNLDESVKSGPAGSEGYTAVEDGMIGYWKRYQFILPNTSMQIPWLQDDVVGAQSNRMYFQYRGGSVPGYSLEDWNGTGGTHNREWYYNSNASGNYNYSAEELIGGGYLGNLTEYDNLTDIETASSNAEMDSISIRLTKVTGALFVDGTPRNNSNVLDTLLINTDDDVYLDGDWQSSTEVRTEGAFTGWNWGPVSSNSVEIDNLINQGPNGEVQWGDTVNIQIEGQLHRSHILINNLEIHPILYSYSQSTNLTTIQVKAAFNQLTDLFGNETQREVYGGSEGLTIESFEHHYSRMNTGILSGFVEGSLVAGAIVQAMDIDKNLMTVVTDGSGGYTFPRAAFGNITAKGGSNPVDGSLYISDDNENLIDDDEIPVAKGTQIGHSSLGGIVSPVSTIATNLLKSMSKSEALESMEETAPSLFGVDLSADDMAAYLAVGLVGFSDANDNTSSQKYNKILQLNKKIEEQIVSFSTGAVSDTASAKDKNKAANTYVKSLTNIIDKGASGKIDAIAASYISENQDSNLGNIDDSTFANNSPEDLIYLTAALAANDIESKIPESSRKLDKNDLKDVSKVIAESITSASFDISSNDSETAFIEAQSINGQRRQGVFAVIDAKSKGQSVSKSTFDAKNSSSVFNIVKEPGGEYKLNSTNAKKPNGQSVSSKIKLTDNRYDFRNSKELRTPSVEINGKSSTLSLSNGRVDNSEQSGNSTIKWKYEGEKKTYLLRYDNLATTYINKHEVVFNSEEFMINRKGEAWNGQSVENWFTASNGFDWYTEGSDGLGQVEGHHQHPSLFLPKYKFLSGSHLKFDNGEGEVRNWNIVDYNTNRQVAKPGSAEEYNILLYFSNFISFIESDGDTTLIEALSGAIQGNRNVDSDSDGVADIYDAFPNDASEVMDSDGDNVGDNADAFPNDASETVDSDGDNVGDNSDVFPNDPSKFEHQPFTYTIDTTLAGDNLTQRFGTGLYSHAQETAHLDLDNENVKLKIDWGEGDGWEYYGKSDSVEGRNLYNTQRYNFEHTYSAHGTYQIRVSYEDVISAHPTVLTQPVPQGIQGWVYGINSTDWSKRVTSIDSWGDMNTIRLFTAHGLYMHLPNCQSWPAVDTSLITEVAAGTYGAPFVPPLASVLHTAKYVTSFNASDWNLTQGKGNKVIETSRYYNRFRDADRLETLNLNGLEYDKYSSAWPDDHGYFGSLVPNGTLVGFNDITIDQDGGNYNSAPNNNGGFQGYLKGRIHKDSTFNNMSINNTKDDIWRVNPTNVSDIITDDSTYTFQQKNWIDTSGDGNKKLKVKNLPSFYLKGTNGEARTSGIDITVDLTSPNGWEINGSLFGQWSKGPNSSTLAAGTKLTILGTGNWDTSNVTNWYRFMNELPNTIILDMDISSWSFEGSPTDAINSFSLPTLKSEQYTKALIAWAASEPSYSATINLGNAQYNQTAHAAKMSLVNDYGWTITDSGLVFDNNETMPTNFAYNATAQADSDEACSLEATSDTAYFFPSSGEYPVAGDWIFTSLNGGTGGTAIIEGSGTYKIESEADYGSHITLDSMGKVTGIGDCSAPEPSSVQYDYGTSPSRDTRGACSVESLNGTFYVAEEIGEEMPATLYSDAELTEAIDFSRSINGYYTFQLNGSSTKRNFNLSRGKFGAVGDCR